MKLLHNLIDQFFHNAGVKPTNFKPHVSDHHRVYVCTRLKNAEMTVQLPGARCWVGHLTGIELIDGFHGFWGFE